MMYMNIIVTTDILKIAQYVAEGGGYTNADEYLKRG